jgi:hypothetical protein
MSNSFKISALASTQTADLPDDSLPNCPLPHRGGPSGAETSMNPKEPGFHRLPLAKGVCPALIATLPLRVAGPLGPGPGRSSCPDLRTLRGHSAMHVTLPKGGTRGRCAVADAASLMIHALATLGHAALLPKREPARHPARAARHSPRPNHPMSIGAETRTPHRRA